MNGAFYIGATGLNAQQRGLDVIANNVANVNTSGFKRAEMRFSELLTPPVDANQPTQPIRAATNFLNGVKSSEVSRVYEQGDLRQTGNPLDLAIEGDGFVEILGPNGVSWLWRGGTLAINEDGMLQTEDGLLLRGLIQIPEDATDIRIDREGRVLAITSQENGPVELGAIDLVMPSDRTALAPSGSGYYAVEGDSGIRSFVPGEDGKGVFVQGSIETSNVELTEEMVALLLMQRAYAANAQVVQAGDQLMSIANGLRR
ncbi:flagellar hook-basal body protein [Sphingorhabdus arenilitoris]|uniref:Flagellar hook-basal body protein n=1 Tax=Sphingorhabdus arenilitoris TaxID=1490041 RepID=A0ABV8RDR3_9SPHN